MRLDKFLSDMKCATRSQLKKEIRSGLVTVNGEVVRQSDYAVDETKDVVCYKGMKCTYEKFVYYMLNKPAGVVSATQDKVDKTVVDLLKDTGRGDLFPVGRLDKDTEGLLLLTNDGELAHNLLSPTKHVEKVYECVLAKAFDGQQQAALEQGVEIGEKKKTMPAKVEVLEEKKILLTIQEGKFHQVKRMLYAVGNEVVFLKRVAMGSLLLDTKLQPGEYRKLEKEEIEMLCNEKLKDKMIQKIDFTKIEAVIFDLDGSLVDSMWMWEAIDREYLARFGIDKPFDLQLCIGGMSFHETAVYFKETFQLPDELDKIKADWNEMAWDKYQNEVPLKEGAGDFIKWCQDRNLKLGIATSNSRELVENVLSVHQLKDAFSSILTGTDIIKGKPEPDVYLAVAKQLQVAPQNCLVFEDIVHGIMAGKAAGMTVCAVYDEFSAATDKQKKDMADYYIHDYKELF